jgi:hypothetical protein
MALMFMQTCRFWKVRLMWRRASSSGDLPATLSPLKTISPAVGM